MRRVQRTQTDYNSHSSEPDDITQADHNREAAITQCRTCSRPFDNEAHKAKLLTCHHSFCLTCLQQLASNKNTFRCPLEECRKKTTVPRDGVRALDDNYYVQHKRHLVPSEVKGSTCAKHQQQPLLFYCETCVVPICMNCTVLDHDRAQGHQIKDIAAAVQLHSEILQDKLRKVGHAASTRDQTLQALKAELQCLETARQMALHKANEAFRQMTAKLQQREFEIANEIEQAYEIKKNQIVSTARTVKSETEKLHRLEDAIESKLHSKGVSDPIRITTNLEVMREIEEVCGYERKNVDDSGGFVQFDYKHNLENFATCLSNLGKVTSENSLPGEIGVTVPPIVASIETTANMNVRSSKHVPLDHYPFTAEIQDPCSDIIPSKVTCQKHGNYNIQFKPQMPGKHLLKIKFLGEDIWKTDTEFQVQSNNPILKIGNKGQESDQMCHPTSVAIGPAGYIYVADMGNKRIQMYDLDGNVKSQFKMGGSGATTYDLAINSATKEVLCTKVGPDETGMCFGNTIRIFSLTGQRISQFTNLEMQKALFLAVNSKGQVIVTDSVANTVFIYSKEGAVIKKFGGEGDKPGQFSFPSTVCIGKNDIIIISDTGNHRIQIFSKTGKFLHQFGSFGYKKGQMKSPRGVAADKLGQHVLVADSQNRIQVFTYEGDFVSCIDSLGDPVREPYNLDITNDGCVFVADFKNNCVKKYKYK